MFSLQRYTKSEEIQIHREISTNTSKLYIPYNQKNLINLFYMKFGYNQSNDSLRVFLSKNAVTLFSETYDGQTNKTNKLKIMNRNVHFRPQSTKFWKKNSTTNNYDN